MKILVTGATGYVGHNLALTLAQQGNHVHILVRNPQSAFIPRHYNIRVFAGDITKKETISIAIQDCEKVFHSILLNNYFTFLYGFYSGFVYYLFMHVFLHKAWAKKVFPHLQVSHIHHHCKYPDRCFSTCLTWWDTLFNTSVPKEFKISDRIIQFYFGKSGH